MAIRKVPQIISQPMSRLCVEPGSEGSTLQVQCNEDCQYQWCKRFEDASSPDQTADQRIFINHSQEFEQQVDATALYPSLYQSHLINKRQMEELAQEVPGTTNYWKIQKLQLWLPQSSKRFLDVLIPCLRQGDDLGHYELANSLENDLWCPLSPQNLLYSGVNDATLVLYGGVKSSHEGVYRCQVTNLTGGCVLSDASHVDLVRPDDKAVEVFVTKLRDNPEKGAELSQTLISRLDKGSAVGYRCLVQAIKRCGECKEVVRAFLASGWSPNQQLETECGRNLVHILSREGHTETLKFVLKTFPEELSLKAADKDRGTALHLAVGAGKLETASFLLEFPAVQETINYQDNEFRTVLHLAVELESIEMVHLLLGVPGIILGILNKDNLKAVEISRKRGLVEMTRILERKEYPPMSQLHNSNIQRSYSDNYSSSVGTLPRGSSSTSKTVSSKFETPDREVLELQAKLTGYTGTLSGKKLLMRGALKKVSRKGDLSGAHFFLLTDVLLYTRYSDITHKYTVSRELSVHGMNVVEVDEDGQPVVKNEPFSFIITSRERALHLVASSEEEKRDWVKAVMSAVAGLKAGPAGLSQGAGLGARAPAWVPDNHVTACQLSRCNKKFSIYVRKHHCRHCGKAVCGACSSQKRYLPYMQGHGRVCNECIEEFSGQKESNETPSEVERASISSYAKRVQGGRTEEKFYKLVGSVLSVYGAHQDTQATHCIPLVGYSVQGDPGRCKVTLTHHQGKEELNESFITLSPEDYESWFTVLKDVSRS